MTNSSEQFFEKQTSDGVIRIAYEIHGSGPILLLVHGFPQSKVIWHRVIPELSKKYTVITPDLRGYGHSSKPKGKTDHSNYSKKEMAQDLVDLMKSLGHDSFYVVGHDRGGRVSHRLAADHPACVKKLMVLDISPTLTMYDQTTMEFARGYWHWFFLIQPNPIPEKLIGSNAEFMIENFMGKRHPGKEIFSTENWNSYISGFNDPETLHGMCEDYRAANTIDLEHDRADRKAGKKMNIPVRVLWGEHGLVNKCFHPIQDWQEVATEVSGKTVSSGHYIPEEIPEELTKEIIAFMQ
jgi:haloacetate dehalogenase